MNKEETDVTAACKAEVSNFFLDTVKPFISTLGPDERKIAMDWSMKIMTLEEYATVKQYLMLLTWMIIKGVFVPPFDQKLSEEKIPEIKNILTKYPIEKVMEKILNRDSASRTKSSLMIDAVRGQLNKVVSYDGVRTSIAASNEECDTLDEPTSESTDATPRRKFIDPSKWDCWLHFIRVKKKSRYFVTKKGCDHSSSEISYARTTDEYHGKKTPKTTWNPENL